MNAGRGLRILVAVAIGVAIVMSALAPPEPQRGRRPEPEWPHARVPVRYTFDEPPRADSPDARPHAIDQPDVLMRSNPPSEWSTGTAFVVESQGVLVTAAHVTDACAQVAVVADAAPSQPAFATEVVQHARADVAVVRAQHTAPPLPVGDDAVLERGATGFGFGYPSGVASAVVGELMGRARGRGDEDAGWWPVMVWALVGREPESETPLGGISGGPMLDAAGRVIGVVIASGSERRPRFVTTTVAPVREALRGALEREPNAAVMSIAIDAADAADYGRRMRGRGTVVSAICHRDDVGRRGR